MIEPRYLKKSDLCAYLCLGKTSVDKFISGMDKDVAAGKLKPFRVYVMPGSGHCHYDRHVIDQYLERRGTL